ncbi:MAG: prepilin-type N-terminal cleavage/methylation domain-containing protein [Rhodoblastus sp.]
MAPKARRAMSRTASDRTRGQDGFTLLETVCALAIVGLVAAVLTPAIPRGTSRTAFESYAVRIAALLKQDRQVAVERGVATATLINSASHTILSGTTGARVILPADVAFSSVLARTCRGAPGDQSIRFFPSGLSCGGSLILSRLGFTLQIRVNWLTGGVEIVPGDAA